MQLELLVPQRRTSPEQGIPGGLVRPDSGYQSDRDPAGFAEAYPRLEPMLAVPCDLLVYEKPLRAAGLTSAWREDGHHSA